MVRVPLRQGRTLHHDILGHFGAGRVLLRSSTPPGASYDAGDVASAGDPLSSGETVWLEIYIEDTEG